jgi:lipoprotein-releasing system permease protein
MLTNSNPTVPAMLVGIRPEDEKGVSALDTKMIQGHLSNLRPNEFGIIIGKSLADKLNLALNDTITVAALQSGFSTSHITPKFKKFKVVGIFQAGGGSLNFDSKMAFVDLQDAQTLFALGSAISGFHLNVSNMYDAPIIAQHLDSILPQTMSAWSWTDQLGGFFENIRMTKTMMFLIFVLIIAVAAFNLICTMVMVVKNKEADIAILRTLGATPRMILSIFLVQGIAISVIGIIAGIAGGILLASNITAISIGIQHLFHVQLVSANVYFVNYLPSDLQWQDVYRISLIAMVLSILATIYPAWNASHIQPVEVLNAE